MGDEVWRIAWPSSRGWLGQILARKGSESTSFDIAPSSPHQGREGIFLQSFTVFLHPFTAPWEAARRKGALSNWPSPGLLARADLAKQRSVPLARIGSRGGVQSGRKNAQSAPRKWRNDETYLFTV